MTPWRKRLNDYRQLLRQAEANYFEPNLFRLNLNSAIQTCRTVTFIIQKEKGSIPDFDRWYRSNVIEATRGDPVMEWLKNSRNVTEKQGDLETFSECALELLFSYTDRGPKIAAKHEGLMGAGIKKMLHFGRRNFPKGVFQDSALIVERRWVANSLPEWELTDALHYGHSKLTHIVDDLDSHVGANQSGASLQDGLKIGSASRRAYVKTNNGEVYVLGSSPALNADADIESAKRKYGEEALRQGFCPGDFPKTFDGLVKLASHMFNIDGTHVTVGFLFDRAGSVSNISPFNSPIMLTS